MTDAETTISVAYGNDGHIAVLTLNRPDKHNAMNIAMRAELKSILLEIRETKTVRVVVLTGAGPSFSSGQDLKERSGSQPVESAEAKRAQDDFQGVLARLPQPTIAALRGYCFGRGIETALTCDLRIASTTVKIRFPELRLGMLPGSGGTQRLTRLIGEARALELILLGRDVEAEEAQRIGLVSAVVEDSELEAASLKMAERIAGQAPLAARFAKRAIKDGAQMSLREGLALEGYLAALITTTADRAEGLKAFLEKRPPVWRGE